MLYPAEAVEEFLDAFYNAKEILGVLIIKEFYNEQALIFKIQQYLKELSDEQASKGVTYENSYVPSKYHTRNSKLMDKLIFITKRKSMQRKDRRLNRYKQAGQQRITTEKNQNYRVETAAN